VTTALPGEVPCEKSSVAEKQQIIIKIASVPVCLAMVYLKMDGLLVTVPSP